MALADLDEFVAYRRNETVARYQSWGVDYSLEQGKSLIDSQIGITFPTSENWLQLGLRNRFDGHLVGDVAIHNLGESEATVEIGFTISKPYQGKGFAKEAVSEVMAYLKRAQHCEICCQHRC